MLGPDREVSFIEELPSVTVVFDNFNEGSDGGLSGFCVTFVVGRARAQDREVRMVQMENFILI